VDETVGIDTSKRPRDEKCPNGHAAHTQARHMNRKIPSDTYRTQDNRKDNNDVSEVQHQSINKTRAPSRITEAIGVGLL
jgi:hypothetical protein